MSNSLSLRDRVQQNQSIGVVEFDSFSNLKRGIFKRYQLLTPRTRVKECDIVNPSAPGTVAKPDNIIVANPSVVYRESDCKYILYFKGNWYDPDWRGVHGIAIGDTPKGPFTPQDDIIFDIRDKHGKVASAEDPFVWYHRLDKRFYGICKDFSGALTGGELGIALLESPDGLSWDRAKNSFFMRKELCLIKGETLEVNRLERPQLLTDTNGNPQVLYCACALEDIRRKIDGSSCNVHIALQS